MNVFIFPPFLLRFFLVGLTFHLRTVTFSDLDKPRALDFMKQYYNYKTNRTQGNDHGVLAIESGTEEPLKNEIIEIPEPEYDKVYDIVGGHIFHLKLFLNDYVSGVPPNSRKKFLISFSLY